MSEIGNDRTLTILDLAQMKNRSDKIVCLTAYDASFSALLDRQGVDVILVGDSLGMVIQGRHTTLPVTVDDMVYHCRCVAQAKKRAMIVADMPFMSYPTPELAAQNAARLMRDGDAQMVKLEGGSHRAEVVRHMVCQGIPVCGHLGLTPQSIHQLGGYKVQGRESAAARAMLEDAQILQDAGAGMLILECIPSRLAAEITESLTIPTIGIGAGRECDGQVLVLHDMLGVSIGNLPRFCKNFLSEASSIDDAVKIYADAVRKGAFPATEHTFD